MHFSTNSSKINWSGRRYMAVLLCVVAIAYLASAIYHTVKPLPQGINFSGKLRHADVKFLADKLILMQKDNSRLTSIF